MKRNLHLIGILLAFTISIYAQKSEQKSLSYRLTKSEKYPISKGVSVGKTGYSKIITLQNVIIPLSNPEPFISFSMRIEGSKIKETDMDIQYSEDGGKTWLPVHHFHEADDKKQTQWVSELMYLDKNLKKISLKIQASNKSTLLTKAVLNFFNPAMKPSGSSSFFAPTKRGAGECDQPSSVPRQSWGSSFNLNENIYSGAPSYTTVSHLIVHHSAGGNTSPNWAATVASIFDFHTRTNGWADIGYNYLIAPDGALYVGRGGGENVVGAHYCGMNGRTMGVCLMGTYMTVAPSDTALKTLTRLLTWKSKVLNINPLNKVQHTAGLINTINGHRSGCATDCPGDMTWAMLDTIRARVNRSLNTCTISPTYDLANDMDFKIYPNPNAGSFNLEINALNNEDIDLIINDMNGRIVFNINNLKIKDSQNMPIVLPKNLPNGFYLVSLKSKNGVLSKKFNLAF